MKKLKLKSYLLKLTPFQIPSNEIQLFKILLRNLHRFKQCILIKNPNPNLKNFVPFATKIITLFQPAFVDSICLKNLNHNLDHQLLPFINILKHPKINITLSIFDTVVEVTVTLIVDFLVTQDINLVLIHAQNLILDTMINPTPIIILLSMIVIVLGMITIITNLLLEHIFLLIVHTKFLPLLVVHPNIILVLVNVPLVIITLLLNDINSHTVLLLTHVLIVTVVDRTQLQKTFQYKPSVNLTQPSSPILRNNSFTEPKFEIIMYHNNTSSSQFPSLCNGHADATTPSTWFVNLYIFKPIEDTSLPSKLELLFLLDSGASVCILNLPTFTILADHFLKCLKSPPHKAEFKILTVANKTEVPILFIVILTLHISIHGSTRL